MVNFNSFFVRKPKKSKFNLSHEVKLTANAGLEIPFLCQEVLPGDTWKMTTEALVKAAPLVAPLMHQVNLKVEFFYCPFRLVWPSWEHYINPTEDKHKSLQLPVFLSVPKHLTRSSTLWDYLGLPTLDAHLDLPRDSCGINALPFMVYQKIWNDYYCDPNLGIPTPLPMDDNYFYHGHIDTEVYYDLLTLQRRCWEKDYFGTAQPDVQRGDDVMLNMSGNATFDTSITTDGGPTTVHVQDPSGNESIQVPSSGFQIVPRANNAGFEIKNSAGTTSYGVVQTYSQAFTRVQQLSGKIEMDSGISINDLRELNTLQRYLERLQLAGTRYTDWLKAMFGETDDDLRLDRPKFIGGGRVPLSIGETLQTSQTTDTSPQGTRTGNFFALASTPSAKYHCKEAGIIMGMLCVIPRTSYYQGIPRQFTKFDRFDFALPMFANLGEQDVKMTELFGASSAYLRTALKNDNRGYLFGYQQRYAEYKYIPSTVHGDFRDSLLSWTWPRKFDGTPKLSSEFLECNPDYNPFAIEDEEQTDHFYIQLYNHINAVRPLPLVSTPKL